YTRSQHFWSGSSVWCRSVGEKICLTKNFTRPIKLSGRALYDDGQMINSNVINHVTKSVWDEFVFNKHGCRWRAEICRFVLEDIDSAFILKEEQRNAIKAFVDRKDVFAVLPTGSGKSLIYQLAPMVYVMVILRCSDWLQVYPIERRGIFFSWFG